MKKILLPILLTGALITTYGQDRYEEYYDDEEWEEQDKKKRKDRRDRDEIKTLSSSKHNGGFFGLTFKATEFNNETIVTTGIRTGWIVARTLAIGFEAHGLVPTAKFDDIAPPDRLVLLGGYGGMFLEPILFSNEIVHLTFPVTGGAGWFGYHEDWEETNGNYSLVYDDIYWYVEPGVSIEVNVAKNFRLAFGATQRITQELELPNTPTRAFDNRNYFVTMKFGRF